VNILQSAGATPQKQPKYVPIFVDRAFTGLYTQRAVLHDPSDIYTSRYYGGRPDALLDGRNIELTNRLTLQRRPGHSPFNNASPGVEGALYPTAPLRAHSFQLSNGNIQVLIDTGSSGNLTITSVANASAGTTVYTGTFPGGASNGYAGMTFVIAGFVTNPTVNNGTFLCSASTTTTLTLNNAFGVAETHAATAATPGGVFLDNQDGTNVLLFGKSVGAGQSYFVSVGGVCYIGDGVDTKKYTPLNIANANKGVWNWGIAAPTIPPTVSLVASGSAATRWQASTVFSPMGLVRDTLGTPQIWQLIGVNADNSQSNTAQFGTSGQGEPNWASAPNEGNTVSDNTVTWTNVGILADWVPNGFYGDLGSAGLSNEVYTAPMFCAPTRSGIKTIYGNYQNGGQNGQCGSAPNEPNFSGSYPGPNYGDFHCHWFAIGNYGTTTGMQGMRWQQSHVYSVWSPTGSQNSINGTPGFILTGNYPPTNGNTVTMFVPTTGGTSGSGYAPFTANAVAGVTTKTDKQLLWLALGQSAWQATTTYLPWTAHGVGFGCIHDGANFQVAQKTNGGNGKSGLTQPGTAIATAVSITASNAVGGNTTYTLGAGSWSYQPVTGDKIKITGFTNGGNNSNTVNANGLFVVVSSTSNTIVVQNGGGVSETHSATIVLNPWAATYSATTIDGDITWVCVSQNASAQNGQFWASGQIWHLPPTGFQPPSNSQAFGGSQIIGTSNNTVQAAINAIGVSGAGPEPTWALPTTIPPTTSDNNVLWQAIAIATTNSLSWSFGHTWAYSYKSRTLTDIYSPTATGGGGAVPPNGVAFLSTPGSQSGAISTASPATVISGANTGSVVTITGPYSPDPQVDTIVIWRSADTASGAGSMLELSEIANQPNLAGTNKQWIFTDFLPDTGNGTFPGLNPLIPAPINGTNNPPLSSFLPMVYNFQRIWGASGQNVLFSGGPDVITGNPNEAFLVSDSLPFLAPVVKLIRTPQGIVTFLTDSIEIIAGGPSTATFFSVTMAPGIGLASFNACDIFAGEVYFFAADNTFRVITPSLNIQNFGFPLGDQFANQPSFGSPVTTWTPANVYVAVHQSGVDNCIIVADGSTGWFRLNPHQVPGSSQGPEPIWSPFALITGGTKMVQSVETSPGVKQLLVGPTAAGNDLWFRNLTLYTDDGSQYDAFFTMGSITLAYPGQISILKFLEFDFSGVGFQPTISYLLNEVSGSFISFVNGTNLAPQPDPPEVYGQTITPLSYSPNRYYFSASPGQNLARCRHMQIKVDFGNTPNGDEMYSMTIFGRMLVEL
jgi:hypothetical protein